MKKSYKGFSYYELLIAIAIMSLMTAFFTISISTVYRNDINRGADQIETSLRKARNNSVSKGTKNGWANFYFLDGALYCYVGEEVKKPADGEELLKSKDWTRIANGLDDVSVEYINTANGTTIMGPGSGFLFTICFQQSTGECVGMKFPNAYDSFVNSETSNYIITLKKRNNKATVKIEKFGNIYIE